MVGIKVWRNRTSDRQRGVNVSAMRIRSRKGGKRQYVEQPQIDIASTGKSIGIYILIPSNDIELNSIVLKLEEKTSADIRKENVLWISARYAKWTIKLSEPNCRDKREKIISNGVEAGDRGLCSNRSKQGVKDRSGYQCYMKIAEILNPSTI